MLLLPLLFLLLRGVASTKDGRIYKQALENLASESLGVQEIQVYNVDKKTNWEGQGSHSS